MTDLINQQSEAGAPSREAIARIFLFESGVFDSDAEIRANQDHTLVIRANRAADRIRALYPTPPALKASELGEKLQAVIAKYEGDELHDEGAFDVECETCRILNDLRALLSAVPLSTISEGWRCAARQQPNGPDTPADCDWPVCGCDPAANKVIEALEESGALPAPPAPAETKEGGVS